MKLRLERLSKIPLRIPQEAKVVPIAGDAAIATSGTGDGRLIPLLILDTTERPDLAEAIRVHINFSDGDVVVQWGELPKRHGHVALILRFQRPVEVLAIVEFDIFKQGILVEHMLANHGVYIQPGKPGDRLMHDLNVPKMLIEIPDTGFGPRWNSLYFDGVVKHLRREGLRRREAKQAAKAFIEDIRGLASARP